MILDLLVDATVRVTILVALGLAAASILRHRSAALRHWVLTLTVAFALASPLVSAFGPAWTIGWPDRAFDTTATQETSASMVTTRPTEHAGRVAADAPVLESSGITGSSGLIGIWLAGVLLNLLTLMFGLVRLSWLVQTATPIVDGAWIDDAGRIAERDGVGRAVRLVRSSHPTLIAAWGAVRPTIILPAASHTWTDDRRQLVLAHELAHVARRDWPAQMAAALLRSIYWFHPLTWIAAARLRRESEHACDDRVLEAGADSRRYAGELLTLARQFGRRSPRRLPAMTMARTSGLQERITAMMNPRLDHTSGTWRARTAALAIIVALAAPVMTAQTGAGALSGTVLDETNRVVPGATVVVSQPATGASSTRRSNNAGQFTFDALPPGAYRVTVSLAGFRTYQTDVIVDRRTFLAPVVLAIGSLSEEVTVAYQPDAEVASPSAVVGGGRPPSPAPAPCTAEQAGGDIREPRKIRDVRPTYPSAPGRQDVEVIVILDGVVSTTGDMRDVRVLRSTNAAFDDAAIDAVSQWKFTPTLLNCEPVEVSITATIRFSPGLR